MDEVYYDDKQGICEIVDVSSKSSDDMMKIVEQKNLPKDTKVFVCLSLENPETLLRLGPLNEWLLSWGIISEPLHLINTGFAVQLGLFYLLSLAKILFKI